MQCNIANPTTPSGLRRNSQSLAERRQLSSPTECSGPVEDKEQMDALVHVHVILVFLLEAYSSMAGAVPELGLVAPAARSAATVVISRTKALRAHGSIGLL